jgi:hypothetical protein
MARSASEALKRELYAYRTSTGPYRDENRDQALADRRDAILEKVSRFQAFAAEPPDVATTVLEPLTPDAYVQERILAQVAWFRSRASSYSARQSQFAFAQFALALASAIAGTILASMPDKTLLAWVAVLTTVLGALSSHLLAQRYEQLTISYRATADRLEGVRDRWCDGRSSFEQLVSQCESTLAQENQAWITGIDDASGAQQDPAGITPAVKSEGRNDRGQAQKAGGL